jgi:hypothetical protein
MDRCQRSAGTAEAVIGPVSWPSFCAPNENSNRRQKREALGPISSSSRDNRGGAGLKLRKPYSSLAGTAEPPTVRVTKKSCAQAPIAHDADMLGRNPDVIGDRVAMLALVLDHSTEGIVKRPWQTQLRGWLFDHGRRLSVGSAGDRGRLLFRLLNSCGLCRELFSFSSRFALGLIGSALSYGVTTATSCRAA